MQCKRSNNVRSPNSFIFSWYWLSHLSYSTCSRFNKTKNKTSGQFPYIWLVANTLVSDWKFHMPNICSNFSIAKGDWSFWCVLAPHPSVSNHNDYKPSHERRLDRGNIVYCPVFCMSRNTQSIGLERWWQILFSWQHCDITEYHWDGVCVCRWLDEIRALCWHKDRLFKLWITLQELNEDRNLQFIWSTRIWIGNYSSQRSPFKRLWLHR